MEKLTYWWSGLTDKKKRLVAIVAVIAVAAFVAAVSA